MTPSNPRLVLCLLAFGACASPPPAAPPPPPSAAPEASPPGHATAPTEAVPPNHGAPAGHPSDPAAGPPGHPGASPHAVTPPPPVVPIVAEGTVTASLAMDRLRAHVKILASDGFEGRGPATKGLGKAANYLEAELSKLKLTPAFGKSYRQPFEMTVGVRLGKKNSVKQGKLQKKVGVDFVPYGFSKSEAVTGPLVFLGYGIKAPEYDYNDYADQNVEGKIVVVLGDEPGETDPKSPFDGRRPTRHSQLRTKSLLAREAKAKAIFVIKDSLGTGKLSNEPESEAGIVAIRITPKVASDLLGFDVAALKAEIDGSYKPRAKASENSADVSVDIVREKKKVDNIGAFIGPADAKETVVLGAHYDHLGLGGADSLSGNDKPEIHNGADDNASGSAAILEVARSLSTNTSGLRRRVLVIWFAGEESGLLGSNFFVKHPVLDLKTVTAMLNLDMVGRMQGDKIHVMGTKTAPEWDALVAKVVDDLKLKGSFGGDGYGPSDHTSFYAEGVPVLFLFTGAHSDYHRPSDDWQKINYRGLAQAGAVAGNLVRILASAEHTPTYVAAPPPPAHGSDGRGYGAYFGSIPDFGEEKRGVLLAGVREGSPADKAGVKKGDVITKFAGITVLNLQDMTVALKGCAPGDEIEVELLRGPDTLKLKATLKKRD